MEKIPALFLAISVFDAARKGAPREYAAARKSGADLVISPSERTFSIVWSPKGGGNKHDAPVIVIEAKKKVMLYATGRGATRAYALEYLDRKSSAPWFSMAVAAGGAKK